MDLERERGITIKASAVTVNYTHSNGDKYMLNLIDTPGHVDFHYEVSRRPCRPAKGRSAAVDATQGVQAQTVANAFAAIEAEPRDHPGHQQDRPARRPAGGNRRGNRNRCSASTPRIACSSSAKTGAGHRRTARGDHRAAAAAAGRSAEAPLQALIFDCQVRRLSRRDRLRPRHRRRAQRSARRSA